VKRALPIFYAPTQYGYNALVVINGQVCTNNGADLHLYCVSVVPQDLSQQPAMSAAITGAVNYTLATYNDGSARQRYRGDAAHHPRRSASDHHG
jgi:hypothetical protein